MWFSSLLIVAIIAVCFSLSVDAGSDSLAPAPPDRRASTLIATPQEAEEVKCTKRFFYPADYDPKLKDHPKLQFGVICIPAIPADRRAVDGDSSPTSKDEMAIEILEDPTRRGGMAPTGDNAGSFGALLVIQRTYNALCTQIKN